MESNIVCGALFCDKKNNVMYAVKNTLMFAMTFLWKCVWKNMVN